VPAFFLQNSLQILCKSAANPLQIQDLTGSFLPLWPLLIFSPVKNSEASLLPRQ
jgi:hypothetical protein